MDESAWEFFCNNSPKLVSKNRPKTPIEFVESFKEKEFKKCLPLQLMKPNLFKKPELLVKSSFRIVYRNKTPNPKMSKSSLKEPIKSVKEIYSKVFTGMGRKEISPLRIRNRGTMIKKKSIKLLKP